MTQFSMTRFAIRKASRHFGAISAVAALAILADCVPAFAAIGGAPIPPMGASLLGAGVLGGGVWLIRRSVGKKTKRD